MRTIDAAAAYLKEQDPDTALTKSALRRLVNTGEVPSVRVGIRYLINLDNLERYMRGELAGQPAATPTGVIHRIG